MEHPEAPPEFVTRADGVRLAEQAVDRRRAGVTRGGAENVDPRTALRALVLVEVAEQLQGEILEGERGPNRWQGAPTTAGEPFDIGAERGALKRRGFEFTETPERMTTPDGRPVSGSFNRDTRQIQISQPHMQKDTHVHEGMHAELLDMQNSPNPHVRKAAGEILQAAGQYSDPEEFLVELATARSRGGRDQNPVMKYLSDNWNALRVIMGAKSPDRMAHLLAERFDEMPSAPVNEPLKKVTTE